jgi:hypothetical protein
MARLIVRLLGDGPAITAQSPIAQGS